MMQDARYNTRKSRKAICRGARATRGAETVAAATWCIAGEAAFLQRRGVTGVYTVGRSVGRGVV